MKDSGQLSVVSAQKAPKQPKQKQEQDCQHKWEYSTKTHRHECAKCGTPAPPNWNEVGF